MNYDLCDQIVTVYRLEDGNVLRQVVEDCYYQWSEEEMRDELGVRMETKFLLVMPGQTQRVFVGDRVLPGCGPELTAGEWASFIPVLVPGLGEVAYVRPFFRNESLCHVEAGRK